METVERDDEVRMKVTIGRGLKHPSKVEEGPSGVEGKKCQSDNGAT